MNTWATIKIVQLAVLVLACCVPLRTLGAERDDLVPALPACVEFDEERLRPLLKLRDVLKKLESPLEKEHKIVEIFEVVNSSKGQWNALSLSQSSVDGGAYFLEYVENPDDQTERPEVKRAPINRDTALAMSETWKVMTMRTRYPTDTNLLYSRSEYHSFIDGGRIYGGWMSMIFTEGRLYSMTRAAQFAKIWLRSEGKDQEAKSKFEMHLRHLQKQLKLKPGKK